MRASFRDRSSWLGTRPHEPGAAPARDLVVDAGSAGAGFTGLSTAHFLERHDPKPGVRR